MKVSPCVSICKTDPVTGYCYGCGRTNEEKKIWKGEKTSEEWKLKNLEDISALVSSSAKIISSEDNSSIISLHSLHGLKSKNSFIMQINSV